MNLAELAERKIEMSGEYAALIFEEKEYTNVQLHNWSKKLAGGIKSLGVKPGERVIVVMPNCPEVLVSYPAIWRVGAVIVPILFLLEAREIAYIAKDCEAVVAITAPEFLYKIEEAQKAAPSLRHIILLGEDEQPGTVSFKKLVEQSDPEESIYPTEDEDMAVLLYTSGTTGRPKGVMLTHKNLHANAMNGKRTAEESDRGDTFLSVLPLSHSFGLGLLVAGYVSERQGKAVLLKWFDLEQVFRAIEKYRVASMAGVPTMFIYMLHYPDADKYDTSSMETWLVAASPMAKETINQFEEKFGGTMYQGYGLTEASPGVAVQRESIERKIGSVGTAFVGVEVKIFDEADNEVGADSVGEIVVRGDNVMKGYYKMPGETEQTLRNGWLRTGDMGYMDKDGHIYIVERKKDLIIRGGFNIYPKDIEEVLYTHPAVAEAAVIGKPDEFMGEEVLAYVVLAPGAEVTADDLIAHCRKNLAKYKSPSYVEFLDSMPKTPIGKIQKKELRKLAEEQA